MVIGEKSGCFRQKWLQIGLFFSGEDGFFQRDFAHSRNKKEVSQGRRGKLYQMVFSLVKVRVLAQGHSLGFQRCEGMETSLKKFISLIWVGEETNAWKKNMKIDYCNLTPISMLTLYLSFPPWCAAAAEMARWKASNDCSSGGFFSHSSQRSYKQKATKSD